MYGERDAVFSCKLNLGISEAPKRLAVADTSAAELTNTMTPAFLSALTLHRNLLVQEATLYRELDFAKWKCQPFLTP
jgi:hypothetical protein